MSAEGLRPPLEPSLLGPLKQLLEQCWHADPAQRPSAAAIASQLDTLLQTLGPEMSGMSSAAKHGFILRLHSSSSSSKRGHLALTVYDRCLPCQWHLQGSGTFSPSGTFSRRAMWESIDGIASDPPQLDLDWPCVVALQLRYLNGALLPCPHAYVSMRQHLS